MNLVSYNVAVRLALARVRESEALCRQIEDIADRIYRLSWPWGAAPGLLPR